MAERPRPGLGEVLPEPAVLPDIGPAFRAAAAEEEAATASADARLAEPGSLVVLALAFGLWVLCMA
eukprot:1157783-Pelagomonas_calceolata.AAC.4